MRRRGRRNIRTNSIGTAAYLLGDLGGVRNKARDAGINLCLQYNATVYDNAKGGLKRGPIAEGQIFSWIDIDLGKLTRLDLLDDTFFHASMYSMQGRPITTREVGSFSSTTFFEELATTRLGTVWLERHFLDGKLSLRAGQLGVDDEFIISPTATAFINSTFGFPGWMAAVLPGGGPAYPLPGPGARVKYTPTDAVTLMAGAYTGDPAGRSNPNPQLANRYGTTFNLNGGTLYIAEAAYSTAYPNSGVELTGTYKIGSWFETAHRFNDLQFDNTGLPLADPSSTGTPKRHGNDWGVYGVIDQTILPGDKDGLHKLASFLRVGASPSDRNLVDFYADGGLTFTGLIPGRPTDLIGVGAAYDRISDAARAFDRDTRLFAASTDERRRLSLLRFSRDRLRAGARSGGDGRGPLHDQRHLVARRRCRRAALLSSERTCARRQRTRHRQADQGCDRLRTEHPDQVLTTTPLHRRGCGGWPRSVKRRIFCFTGCM